MTAEPSRANQEPAAAGEREDKSGSPAWKVLEPADQTDAVPHELLRSVRASGRWLLVGASVRGRLHAHHARWREDSFAIGAPGGWHILVVGDGAGSCPLSRIGSRLACDSALAELGRRLDGYVVPSREPEARLPEDAELLRIKAHLIASVRAAQSELGREAERRGIPVHSLSTTLLVAVHTSWQSRELVASVQIGDGAIALWGEPNGLTLIGTPDHGEYSGETRFLTSQGMEEDLDRRVQFVIRDAINGLVAMTDGVADDFFPPQQRLPELFSLLGERIGGSAEAPERTLGEWIKYEKKGSSDDRALVLLYRTESACD